MQIDESRKLLFSDTLVPDIFITEYLPTLDGLAVKLYLYALFAARNRRTLSEAEIARRLGVDPDAVRGATAQLSAAGLVQLKERGFELVDVKEAEVAKIYRPRTSVDPGTTASADGGPSAVPDGKRVAREKLLGDIAKTFFQGLMSPSWYGEIETWFERYRFEPEVIYALFQYCARRGKLDGRAYIAKVAESWSGRGILTFEDLSAYFSLHDKVSGIGRKVGKKLRKGMTEYDEEKVAVWVEKMGYDFDVIELALRRTVKLQNPNLDYVGRILEEWFAAGLRTPEDVDRYESERVRRLSAERSAGRAPFAGAAASGRPRNAGNFDQRVYSDEYLSSLYDEVPPVDGAATGQDADAVAIGQGADAVAIGQGADAVAIGQGADAVAIGQGADAVMPGQMDIFHMETRQG